MGKFIRWMSGGRGRMADGPWFGDEWLTLEQPIYGYTLGAAREDGLGKQNGLRSGD